MPRIPLYNFQPTASPQSTVRADPGMYEPIHRGQQAISQGISHIGQAAADFSNKLQSARDAAILTDAELAYNEAENKFLEEREGKDDFDKWEADYEKILQATPKAFESQRLSSQGRATLDAMTKRWQQRSGHEVKSVARAKEIGRIKGVFTGAYDRAISTDDREGALRAIDTGVAQHIFSPEEAQAYRTQTDLRLQHRAIANRMIDNPAALVEELSAKDDKNAFANYPAIQPEQRLQLIDAARLRFYRQREDQLTRFSATLQKGDYPSDEELDTALSKGLINDQERATLSRTHRQKIELAPAQAIQSYKDTIRCIAEFDPATASPEARNDIRSMLTGLVGTSQASATRMFEEKCNPDSPLNGPNARAAMSIVKQNLTNGIYGNYQQPKRKKETLGDGTTRQVHEYDATGKIVYEDDPKMLQAAHQAAADDYEALTAQIRANPRASKAELKAFLAGRNSRNIAAAGARIVQSYVANNPFSIFAQ